MINVLKTFTILGLIAGALGVGVFSALQRDNVEAEAATTQTHRRLYAYTKEAWTKNAGLYIYYWGGASNEFDNADQMTLVLTDYWQGFYCFDIPVAATSFLLKNAKSGDGTLKTNDISVSSLFTGTDYLVFETWGSGASYYPQTTVGMNNGQVAAVLSKIDSCSPSYASGYNAWPQLNDLFITPNNNAGFASTYLVEPAPYNSTQPTISQKISLLSSEHLQDSSNSLVSPNPREESSTGSIVLLSGLSITALGGYFFLQKKKFL